MLLRCSGVAALVAAHIKYNLLRGELLETALHLLLDDVGGPTIVLLFARGLGPDLVLLRGVQAVEPVFEVGNPLAVEEGFCRGFIIPCIMSLIDDID